MTKVREKKQGVNYPWEMMYSVIFVVASNFPYVSTLLWENEILYSGTDL